MSRIHKYMQPNALKLQETCEWKFIMDGGQNRDSQRNSQLL